MLIQILKCAFKKKLFAINKYLLQTLKDKK